VNIPSDPPQEGDSRHVADQTASDLNTEADRHPTRHHVNPARMEVRVRRIALIGLILVPVVYFVVQSLR